MKYVFGDIVVVEDGLLGVIIKDWITLKGEKELLNHEVYVRSYNSIRTYPESKIERYLVRHRYLDKEEKKYQYNAINNL